MNCVGYQYGPCKRRNSVIREYVCESDEIFWRHIPLVATIRVLGVVKQIVSTSFTIQYKTFGSFHMVPQLFY